MLSCPSRLLLAALVLAPAITFAQSAQVGAPEPNPARPTVSTPATLTPLGYLQFETGAFFAQTSPEFSTLTNLNEVVKLTVHPRLELILATSPITGASSDLDYTGFAGLALGFQSVLLGLGEANTTLSVGYLHETVGSEIPDIDIGTPVNSGQVLLSTNLRGFHFDINAIFNQQTVLDTSKTQYGQTVSASHTLWSDKLIGQAEIWHFTQPFLNSDAAGLLWAISWAPKKNLVFDAGFQHGLTSTSTQWEEFFGFTYLLPHRLWKGH